MVDRSGSLIFVVKTGTECSVGTTDTFQILQFNWTFNIQWSLFMECPVANCTARPSRIKAEKTDVCILLFKGQYHYFDEGS